jgi:hypothetical protein
MVMDELAVPASLSSQSNFAPIPSQFDQALLPTLTNFETSQSQAAMSLMTDHVGLKSKWVPEEPLAGNEEPGDESDDQICISLDKASHLLKPQNDEQGEKR